jgi:curved DNA-binding protein CbpA
MTRKYFKAVWTAEECKERFKELVKKLHPDNNPGRDTTRDFQDMNAEFIQVYNELKNVHRRKDDGTTYTETRTEYTAKDDGSEFSRIFTTLFNLDGLVLEICGSWLWVKGETYKHKEIIKDLGLKYSRKHVAWYYASTGTATKKRSYTPMERIRELHGSEIYTSRGAETKQIASN